MTVNTLNNAHSATRTFCSHFSLKGCCTVCPSSKQVTQWVFVEVYHQIGNTQCESILKGYDTNYGTDFGLLLLFLFFRLLVCSFVCFCLFRGIPLKPIVEALSTYCNCTLFKKNLRNKMLLFRLKRKLHFPPVSEIPCQMKAKSVNSYATRLFILFSIKVVTFYEFCTTMQSSSHLVYFIKTGCCCIFVFVFPTCQFHSFY